MPGLDQLDAPNSRHDLRRDLRSSSPAVKRPASDMGAQDREDYSRDVEMDEAGPSGMSSPPPDHGTKAKLQNTGQRHERSASSLSQGGKQPVQNNRTTTSSEDSVPLSSDSGTNATSDISTLNTSTPSSAQLSYKSPSAEEIPPLDEQVQKIIPLIEKSAEDKQKGFVVSTKWLYKVVAKSSIRPEGLEIDKSASEGELGPVENSDIVVIIDGLSSLTEDDGEQEAFIALRPGLIQRQDFRVLPQEAWDLITKWYGSKGAPVIRYAHKISSTDDSLCEYEIYPPVFSLIKVPASHTQQINNESREPPIRMVASRETLFQDWLRRAKGLLHVPLDTKVRPWKIRGGLKGSHPAGMRTPADSRSGSPAPGADLVASAGDSMIIDVNTFAALRTGEQREAVEHKDETANSNYNGKSLTLNIAGLSRDEVIALEESNDSGDWASSKIKTNFLSSKGLLGKPKITVSNGRQSPAPGMMTRGRQRRDERPKGITGLSNLGNTCYMNSALQCLRSVHELTVYFLRDFWKEDLNPDNPLGHHGSVARAYADLLNSIYQDGQSSFSPSKFKNIIGKYGPNFAGYGQQDSQEFLLFLLDGLQEDLNRIKKKPYIEKPDSTDEMVKNYDALKAFADRNWADYKARNDSVVTDLFAGMYKSTVTCPVCEKVSIIFDPFSHLTLQLPIENVLSLEVYYFPLYQPPMKVKVEVDKMGTMKDIKRFIAQRMQTDVDRLIMSEIYRNRFYKVFNNNSVIADASIQKNDIIAVFELDTVPTNYRPDKARRPSIGMSFTTKRDPDDIAVDEDSDEAERLLVPVFHRRTGERSGGYFAEAGYIVLNRQDRCSYERILQKLLGIVMTMTTKPILTETEGDARSSASPEDSDTMLVGDEDRDSSSAAPYAQPVAEEDSLVEVRMSDDSPPNNVQADSLKVLQPGAVVPASLRSLFEIKKVSTRDNVPTGWNEFNDAKDFKRISDPGLNSYTSQKATRAGGFNVVRGSRGPESVSSDEDDVEDIAHDPIMSSSIGSRHGSDDQLTNSQSDEDSSSPSFNTKRVHSKTISQPTDVPLISPGDAIILDWSSDAYDVLFMGKPHDEWRGSLTYDTKYIPTFSDPELAAKQEQRQSRRKKGLNLADCLNEFGKSETLSENNAWYCPRCKEHRRAEKRFEIWKTPDILVMQLKRFSSNRNWRDKLEILVDYPLEDLDLSDKVIDHPPGKSLVYDLIAVDNHYGGLGGGHYTAFAKSPYNGTWYEYNDSHVSARNDPAVVVTPAAYLLFYRRRSEHPLGGPRLQKVVDVPSGHEADSELQSDSREPSPPAGEGRRLGGSSHNGSSSAFALDQAHRVGDGGLQTEQKMFHGVLQRDDGLPSYIDSAHDEMLSPARVSPPPSEMVADSVEGWDSGDPWSMVTTWKADNQPIAAPNSEEGAGGSTKAEDGERTPESMEIDLPSGRGISKPEDSERRTRASAPPPEKEDDDDDLGDMLVEQLTDPAS